MEILKRCKWEARWKEFHLPLIPRVSRRYAFNPDRKAPPEITSFQSPEHTIGVAEKERRALSQTMRRQFENGDYRAIHKILEYNEGFINEPWVQAGLRKLGEKGLNNKARQHYGRRYGGTNFPRHWLRPIIDSIAEKQGGIDKAFAYIESREEMRNRFGTSIDRLRTNYFEEKRNPRNRVLAFHEKGEILDKKVSDMIQDIPESTNPLSFETEIPYLDSPTSRTSVTFSIQPKTPPKKKYRRSRGSFLPQRLELHCFLVVDKATFMKIANNR
jgi:hypothetical protein